MQTAFTSGLILGICFQSIPFIWFESFLLFKLVFYYSNPPKYREKGKENGTERIFNYHRNCESDKHFEALSYGCSYKSYHESQHFAQYLIRGVNLYNIGHSHRRNDKRTPYDHCFGLGALARKSPGLLKLPSCGQYAPALRLRTIRNKFVNINSRPVM
jgi:hypothetical protein